MKRKSNDLIADTQPPTWLFLIDVGSKKNTFMLSFCSQTIAELGDPQNLISHYVPIKMFKILFNSLHLPNFKYILTTWHPEKPKVADRCMFSPPPSASRFLQSSQLRLRCPGVVTVHKEIKTFCIIIPYSGKENQLFILWTQLTWGVSAAARSELDSNVRKS